MMEKIIENYLHFYLGGLVEYKGKRYILSSIRSQGGAELYEPGNNIFWVNKKEVKPVLTPLSNMTEEVKKWIASVWNSPWPEHEYNPVIPVEPKGYAPSIFGCAEITRQLCKQGYDLFGLIDAGLATSATP